MAIKLKSFGLIESIIGSVIIVLVLTAAAALASSTSKSARLNSAYFEAQHISDELLSYVIQSEVSGRAYFDEATRASSTYYSIDCFSSDKILNPPCRSLATQFSNLILVNPARDSQGYIPIGGASLKNPAFSSNNFSYKISVKKPEDLNYSDCGKVGSTTIPPLKCRYFELDIKWQEPTGEKHYKINQLFTDWKR